jgi:hypothetical protein
MGFDSWQERKVFLLYTIQTGCKGHVAPYTMNTGTLSQGVKWPEGEANHSSPSTADARNCGAIPPFPLSLESHGLIKHRGNFTSFFKFA